MATDLVMPKKLWEHPDPKSTQMWWFMKEVERRRSVKLEVSPILFFFLTMNAFCNFLCALYTILYDEDDQSYETAHFPKTKVSDLFCCCRARLKPDPCPMHQSCAWDFALQASCPCLTTNFYHRSHCSWVRPIVTLYLVA